MPSPATVRERRLRKTKAQPIDEIDTLEQHAAAIEAAYGNGAPLRETAFESGDRVFAFSIAAVTGETTINICGRDISREHAAKQELAEKDAQLWVALDNLPGGTALYDRDLNYVLFNAQYSQLCEFPDGLVKVGVLDDPASR